ncbi:MAG: hypothetical protein AB7R77_05930 [Ilumatobacteraceae bacterium]
MPSPDNDERRPGKGGAVNDLLTGEITADSTSALPHSCPLACAREGCTWTCPAYAYDVLVQLGRDLWRERVPT